MSTSLQPVHALVPGANLEAYVHAVNSIPLLTPEQERELAENLFYQQDLEAARQMVLAHLRFVVHIARSYSGYGLAQADLIQEGNVGLMKAVKRFNPEMGVRLVSFAVHWIRAEIHEFILKNWRIVKVATTKAQRKLFFNLRSQKKRLAWLNNDEVTAVAGNCRPYRDRRGLTRFRIVLLINAVSSTLGSRYHALLAARNSYEKIADVTSGWSFPFGKGAG